MRKILLSLMILGLTGSGVMAEEVRVVREVRVKTGEQVLTNGIRIETQDAKAEARGEYLENSERRVQIQQMEQVRTSIAARHATRLEWRYQFYYQRLSAIMAKIQARLEAIAHTEAQAKLTEAKAVLEEAKVLGERAVKQLGEIDPERYAEQRSMALGAGELANQAREKFREAVRLMREAVIMVSGETR